LLFLKKKNLNYYFASESFSKKKDEAAEKEEFWEAKKWKDECSFVKMVLFIQEKLIFFLLLF
jgi:hypothetical protein